MSALWTQGSQADGELLARSLEGLLGRRRLGIDKQYTRSASGQLAAIQSNWTISFSRSEWTLWTVFSLIHARKGTFGRTFYRKRPHRGWAPLKFLRSLRYRCHRLSESSRNYECSRCHPTRACKSICWNQAACSHLSLAPKLWSETGLRGTN